MDNISIIKDVESLLPTDFKCATILFQNTSLPLYYFLENKFINFVKDGANAEVLANYIKNNLMHLIRLNDPRLVCVDEFIKNNPVFIDVIQISKDKAISAREELSLFCIENMNEDGTIKYLDKTISIDELYLKLLNNSYHEPTIEEKAEQCINMIQYIDNEILDSIIDGMNITVRDYICEILPTRMSSEFTIEFNGESVEIAAFVKEIVDHQAEMLAEKKAKAIEDLENQYNRTSDNPGLVSEIQVRLENDNSLTVTAEIPVVASSLLTDEEKTSLLENYSKKESVTDTEYLNDELNKIKQAIDNTNHAEDLDACVAFFKSIINNFKKEDLPSQINQLIVSIDELITVKRHNIIKVNGNLEEYTDVLFSEINKMNDEMSGYTTLDQFSTLYGRALDRYQEVLKKGIKDIQLKESFNKLFDNINKNRLNLDATIGYQSPEVERAKVDLNTLITEIKQDILTIEHDSNNLGNLAGTAIRVDSNIKRTKEQVEQAYSDGLLTEDDREYYMNRLKGYSMAIQSEKNIGYGIY